MLVDGDDSSSSVDSGAIRLSLYLKVVKLTSSYKWKKMLVMGDPVRLRRRREWV